MAYIYKVKIDSGSEIPVASSLHGTSSTASATAAKAVTLSTFDAYQSGILLSVKFSNAQTADAAITLNVNSKGAKNVYVNGSATSSSNPLHWGANATLLFLYDGTQFHAIGNDTNTDTLVKQTASTNANARPILMTYSDSPTSGNAAESVYSTSAKIYPSSGNISVGAISTDGEHFYEIGAAAEKSVGSIASGNTGLVTGGDVFTYVAQQTTGSLYYAGTATSNTDIGTSYQQGWYWIVGTGGGTIAGQTCEAGDMILAHAAYSGTIANDLDFIQTNLDAMTTSDIDSAVSDAS